MVNLRNGDHCVFFEVQTEFLSIIYVNYMLQWDKWNITILLTYVRS
jgi:hypothetical protein